MPKLILDQTVIVHLKLMMKGWALLSNTLFSAIVCSTLVEMMRMVVVMVTVVSLSQLLASNIKGKKIKLSSKHLLFEQL